MPRVIRRKKRQRQDGRPLTFKESFVIRNHPEGYYPEWAVARVEALIERATPPFVPRVTPPRKYGPGEELALFQARRDAFVAANAERYAEYDAYQEDETLKPEWFTGTAQDFVV